MFHAWGLLPLNAFLVVTYARNLMKWRGERVVAVDEAQIDDQRKVVSRLGAALAVESALTPLGFEPVVRDDADEPIVSLRVDTGRWIDVFVTESAQ